MSHTLHRAARIAAVSVLAALVLGAQSRSADEVLLKLPKRQPVAVAATLVDQMTPVQELDAAWLAMAPGALVADLRSAGVSFEVVDPSPSGKTFYLVFARDDQQAALRRHGDAWRAEDGAWLFATRSGNVREQVPAEAQVKLVAGPIATPMVFTTGEVGHAARRAQEAAAQPATNPVIAEMVSQVSSERLMSWVSSLENFGTRYASTTSCEASANFIFDSLGAFGLQTELELFQFGTAPRYTTSNVIATLPGRVDPSRVVIVSAHYDSYSDQRTTLAPGADDNASGTAAVMDLASIMSRYQFDYTLKFIAWGAEEWGLVGSRYYAQRAKARGENVVASLTLDMIGYADAWPEDLDIRVNPASEWLYDRFAAAASAYASLATVKTVGTSFGSDCTSFWEQDYPSLCGIEDYPLRNPYYHKTTDRSGTLDARLVAASSAATLALAAELAQPLTSPRTPTKLTASSAVSRSVFSRAKSVSLAWNASADPVRGYHVYRSTTAHAGFQKVTTTPVTSTSYVDRALDARNSYYYVVTAVDTAGRESNFSNETGDGAVLVTRQ